MQSVDWFYTKEGGLDADEVYTSCPEAFAGDKIRLGMNLQAATAISGCRGKLQYPKKKKAARSWGILISAGQEEAETAVLRPFCT